MCDHQVAHVFVSNPDETPAVRNLLSALPGVASACSAADAGLDHAESGELVLTAQPRAWFAYPWWDTAKEAPDYATHVDIHSKIGYDPCELFWNIPFLSTSTDCRKPKGTHGRSDAPAAVAVSDGLAPVRDLTSHLDICRFLKQRLQSS